MPTTKPAWITRVWQEYRAGNLTRAFRDVLLTLRTFRGHGGQCWPSHDTLADRTECCIRTVQRALKQAQHLGLVDWVERRVRTGWRWLRTSNRYWFITPAAPVQAGMRPVFRAPALSDIPAGEGRASKKVALEAVLRAAAVAPDLLAARRAAMRQRLIEAAMGKAW
jgi:DNA-binding transcriptional MocR family regulator